MGYVVRRQVYKVAGNDLRNVITLESGIWLVADGRSGELIPAVVDHLAALAFHGLHISQMRLWSQTHCKLLRIVSNASRQSLSSAIEGYCTHRYQHADLKYNFEIQNPCLVALLPVVSWYGICRCSVCISRVAAPALAMSSWVLLSRSTNPFREVGASSDSNHGRLEEDTLTHLQPWLC